METRVLYEQALKLKELGFDKETCLYKDNISNVFSERQYCNWNASDVFVSIPTYEQAFDFFEEKFSLEGHIKSWKKEGKIVYYYSVNKLGDASIFKDSLFCGNTKLEAKIACLDSLINKVC